MRLVKIQFLLRVFIAVSFALALQGCVLAPEGTSREQQRLESAGAAYRLPFDKRELPELSERPTWQELLHRAFLVNGDLEASYFEWSAALSRIPQEAVYPNTNIAPSFSYMFSGEQMKSTSRMACPQ